MTERMVSLPVHGRPEIGPRRTCHSRRAQGSHHICTRHHDTGEWLAILEVDDGEVLESGVGEER
jgi:hypothetical protein